MPNNYDPWKAFKRGAITGSKVLGGVGALGGAGLGAMAYRRHGRPGIIAGGVGGALGGGLKGALDGAWLGGMANAGVGYIKHQRRLKQLEKQKQLAAQQNRALSEASYPRWFFAAKEAAGPDYRKAFIEGGRFGRGAGSLVGAIALPSKLNSRVKGRLSDSSLAALSTAGGLAGQVPGHFIGGAANVARKYLAYHGKRLISPNNMRRIADAKKRMGNSMSRGVDRVIEVADKASAARKKLAKKIMWE